MASSHTLPPVNDSAATETATPLAPPVLAGFRVSRPVRRRARRRNRTSAAGTRIPAPTRVVNHDLFRDAVRRERNRAHRYGEAFMLLRVEMDGADPRPLPRGVVSGVAAATRNSDVVGWIERGRALGVILSALPSEQAALRSFDARLRRALAACVDTPAAAQLAIRHHFYSRAASLGTDTEQDDFLEALSGDAPGGLRDWLKRAIDVVLSAAVLFVLLPLLAVIAILTKATSRGPVLFRQDRIGYRGRPFVMLKFRTMRLGADHAVHQQYVTEFITKSEALASAGGNQLFKLANDSRVTRLGRILRKTSMDELPQLWNVLRGDMSLVGPRPPLQYEVEKYQPWHWRRVLDARPGITGLWQVTGRSRTTFDGMVRLDLRYVKTRSVWTDLKILFATPGAVVAGKGAC